MPKVEIDLTWTITGDNEYYERTGEWIEIRVEGQLPIPPYSGLIIELYNAEGSSVHVAVPLATHDERGMGFPVSCNLKPGCEPWYSFATDHELTYGVNSAEEIVEAFSANGWRIVHFIKRQKGKSR